MVKPESIDGDMVELMTLFAKEEKYWEQSKPGPDPLGIVDTMLTRMVIMIAGAETAEPERKELIRLYSNIYQVLMRIRGKLVTRI